MIADSSGRWSSNGLRFATEAEALDNARCLAMRWTLVVDYRAAPSEDAPNYKWTEKGLESL